MRIERSVRRFLSIAAVALPVTLAATGCGDRQNVIRIGVSGDCHGGGAAGAFYENALAGAELPFVERGASLRGAKPSDGVSSVTVAGSRVELVIGCDVNGSFTSILSEARRLVEREGVDVLVTPTVSAAGLVIREYAGRRPGVTFVVSSGELRTPLVDPAPNLFRFAMDLTQGSAGLGAYAYHTLGWRTAVTLGEDDVFGYPIVAGFVAEFCSLGGTVVKRLWAPSGITDWSRLVRQIPADVDGVALMAFLQGTSTFFSAYEKVEPDLSRHVVMSAYPLALGERPVGVVASHVLPLASTAPSWVGYLREFEDAFPAMRGQGGNADDVFSYDSVQAALQAIERVHGDISGGERRFQVALATSRVRTPAGTVRLDRNRQAIGPGFLVRVERAGSAGAPPRTVRVVPNVEETFNGYFTATSPPDSRTEPVCRKGNPPPWAR